jgi:D-arabinose 1-dehydrogenase-like Zn-dependent alcohol dehydrogenase
LGSIKISPSGHEVIGEVAEIGPQVTHLKVGDRVGVGWQRSSCLQCRDCLRGNESLLLMKQRRIVTSLIGGRAMINQMLAIAEKFGIEPIVEVFAIAQANEAMQKVRDNQVRYRAVLTVS